MISKMVNYEQSYNGMWRKNGEPAALNYYDPNMMLAEKAFRLEPNEEALIVINGTGYRYSDETIYELEFFFSPTTDNDDMSTNAALNCDTIVPNLVTSNQLCFLIKNCATNCTIYVGCKSPLHWLLNLPRVSSKMCYSSLSDITKCRLNITHLDNYDEVDSGPAATKTTNKITQAADDETIVIKYA